MADKAYPRTEAEANLFFQNMANVLPTVNGQLGLAQADVDFFVKQAQNYQYLLNVGQEISDQKEAFTTFKNAILEGDPLAPAPTPPLFPVISAPQELLSGLDDRAKAIIKRIKASPGYNQTLGEQLGLVDTGPAPFNPNDLTAALKLTSKPGSVVEIAFSKQGMDAMRVEFKRKTDTDWQLAGIYLSSPGTHISPSVPPDEPESRQYRGILMKKNDPIGNPSPLYPVVTTP